jgi:hypothetical protein
MRFKLTSGQFFKDKYLLIKEVNSNINTPIVIINSIYIEGINIFPG